MTSATYIVVAGLVLSLACQPAPSAPEPPVPNRGPAAKIAAFALGREGSPFPFDASASSDPDDDPLTYAWDFGDGNTEVVTSPVVEHVYRNNGTFLATLVVSDSHGATDTASTSLTIANVAPQITAFKVPATATVGVTYSIEIQYFDPGVDDTLDASLFLGHGGAGGGVTLHGPAIVPFTPSDTGKYFIAIWVGDNDGASSYREDTVTVARPAGSMPLATRGHR